MIKAVAWLGGCLLVACGQAPAPEVEITEALHLEIPQPESPALAVQAPRIRRLDRLPELGDPTLILLENGCPISNLQLDDFTSCDDALCLDGRPATVEFSDDGRIHALSFEGAYSVRCDEGVVNENWWRNGQWQRQRITTLRDWDDFGVAWGLTEIITREATQVIRFDVIRDAEGVVAETRRRLFPSRGQGVCQDELRAHADGGYHLEVFDCMQGW